MGCKCINPYLNINDEEILADNSRTAKYNNALNQSKKEIEMRFEEL